MNGLSRKCCDSRRLRTLGALIVGFFLAYLISLPPHLVHHLFEEDAGHPECPLLAQSQQTPVIQAVPPVLAPLSPAEILEVSLLRVSLPSAVLTISYPRAPPHSTPSA